MALTTLLEQVLENAENLGTERALALVRTCVSLGPEILWGQRGRPRSG